MPFTLRRIASALSFLATLAQPVQADVSHKTTQDEAFGRVMAVIISNEIVPDDLDRLLALDAEVQAAETRMVMLASQGGDLGAAMEMGRFLRRYEFTAVILDTHVCLSACVFLLAAGVDKKVQGVVGIHRPYFTMRGDIPPAQAIKEVKAEAEAYLVEMNLPARLAEDMFSTDPADMRLLNDDELRDYRLNSMDFVYREENALNSAEQYGLSRQDYEAFRKDLNYTCQIYSANHAKMLACIEDVADRHGVDSLQGIGGAR